MQRSTCSTGAAMAEPRRLVTYNLPLTEGDPAKAVLIVPVDLTRDEALRLQRFISTLADVLDRSSDG
jgi:hypothetical protein